jgi:hypothetical protein
MIFVAEYPGGGLWMSADVGGRSGALWIRDRLGATST